MAELLPHAEAGYDQRAAATVVREDQATHHQSHQHQSSAKPNAAKMAAALRTAHCTISR